MSTKSTSSASALARADIRPHRPWRAHASVEMLQLLGFLVAMSVVGACARHVLRPGSWSNWTGSGPVDDVFLGLCGAGVMLAVLATTMVVGYAVFVVGMRVVSFTRRSPFPLAATGSYLPARRSRHARKAALKSTGRATQF